MAPKAAKEKAPTDTEACALMLDYLVKTNRPYSANDISANLHNKVSKTQAAKLLKEMHERKEIEGCASGKQLVYHAVQDVNDEISAEELFKFDSRIEELRTEIAKLRASEKSLRSQLATLQSNKAPKRLKSLIAEQRLEIGKLQVTLNRKKESQAQQQQVAKSQSICDASGDKKPMCEKDYDRLEEELRRWCAISNRRKRIIKELWSTIEDAADAGGLDKNLLREQFDLTT